MPRIPPSLARPGKVRKYKALYKLVHFQKITNSELITERWAVDKNNCNNNETVFKIDLDIL